MISSRIGVVCRRRRRRPWPSVREHAAVGAELGLRRSRQLLSLPGPSLEAPPKSRLGLARIVGVQIDVNPCNKVVPKLEDVTEPSAGGLARFPGLAVRH